MFVCSYVYYLALNHSSNIFFLLFKTILGRPGPPVGPIKFESISADQMTLSWLPPLDDGGSKITNYVIEKREANRKTWVRVSSEPKECTYTIPKLLEGHAYVFRIMAQNKFGVGEPLDSEPETARNLFCK